MIKTIRKLPRHQRSSPFAAIIGTDADRSTSGFVRVALNKFWVPVLTLFIALSSQHAVDAALVNRKILAFSGTLDPIQFPLAAVGMMVDTGIISVSLDPTATNVFGLDDSTASGAIDVTLLVSFELLDVGEIPSIQIVETGAASIMAGSGSGNNQFSFQADLMGGGTVMTGLLTGVEFSNVNAYNGEGFFGSWVAASPPDITWALNSSATVTFPTMLTGEAADFVVTGIDGSGTMTLVPEPGTLMLGLLGLLSVAVFRGLARKKASRHRLG